MKKALRSNCNIEQFSYIAASMASVKILFDTRLSRKNGKYPIVIRVDHKGVWNPVRTGISITTDQWDGSRIIKSKDNPTAGRNNSTIINALGDAETFIADNAARLNSMSCAQLRDEIQSLCFGDKKQYAKDVSINDYFEKIITEMKAAKRIKYADSFNQTRVSVGKFKNCPLIKVDATFIRHYNDWMLSTGMTGGIPVYMRNFRRLCNLAISEKICPREWYPFQDFKIKKVSTMKRAIKKVDIDAIRNLKLKKGTSIWHHWNYFRFYFNAGGMNFIDIAFLTMREIESGRLVYTRRKTKRPYSVLLTSEMKEVLSHYTKFKTKKDFIFPIMDDVVGVLDDEKLNKIYESRLKNHNVYLNRLAKLAGLDVSLTTYVFRHSVASSLRDDGAPIYVIQETLGHGNAGITQTYLAQVSNDEKDKWIAKLMG